jgi:hypothetical protein
MIENKHKLVPLIKAIDRLGRKRLFEAGDRVRVVDGEETYTDTVRACFVQKIFVEPHGRNQDVESLVLSKRSWCQCNQATLISDDE